MSYQTQLEMLLGSIFLPWQFLLVVVSLLKYMIIYFLRNMMIYLHLPEGQLIAAPINHEFFRCLAVYGFAIAESVPHLNQMEQLPNNIASILRRGDLSSMILSLGVGALAGVAHASQALLAVIATGVGYTVWFGPLVEFVIGFSEAQQHAVPAARRLCRSTFFNSKSAFEIKTGDAIQLYSSVLKRHESAFLM